MSNLAQVNVRFICTFLGFTLLRRGSKNKNKLCLQFAAAILLTNHVLYSPLVNYCRLPIKMYFLLFNVTILFISICATVIVGTSVVHPKRCRTGSNSIYQSASELARFLKIDRPFLVLANLPIIQFPMTLLLVNTSWTISCAHFITITIDSPYFPLVALLFIAPLWRLLSIVLFNLISVDKKNLFTALKFFINTLDFDRPFSRPIKLSVSFDDAQRYINSVWLEFTPFWRFPLISVRWKTSGWTLYYWQIIIVIREVCGPVCDREVQISKLKVKRRFLSYGVFSVVCQQLPSDIFTRSRQLVFYETKPYFASKMLNAKSLLKSTLINTKNVKLLFFQARKSCSFYPFPLTKNFQ